MIGRAIEPQRWPVPLVDYCRVYVTPLKVRTRTFAVRCAID